MYKNLSAGAIGIRGASLQETVRIARDTSFGGVDFDIREAAALLRMQGTDFVHDLFAEAGVRPGQWGLPVAWRDDARWEEDLAALPALAAVGQTLGCTRTATWCPPFSDDLPFEENFEWHVARYRPIAQVLKDFGCSLGIEFIGPETLRKGKRYPFIYTLQGMMKLADAIGTGNVGLLLDAWHLYTSGGALDDLDAITASDIVTVHVNDAPAGVALADQIDNTRALPMETGVIDLPGFIRKLDGLGYDGPVTAEPFSAPLDALAAQDPMAAARLTSEALDRMMAAAGIA